MNIRDKYQITETPSQLSFRPFHHYKKRLKWYTWGIVMFSISAFFYFHRLNDEAKVVSLALLLVMMFFLIKDVLLKPAIVYIFDKNLNAVYQKTLFSAHRKVLNLDEVVIFKSSEMGSWNYVIGAKRKQFLKNFAISENFGSGKKAREIALAFEEEIIDKIYVLIENKNCDI